MTVTPRPLNAEAYRLFELASSADSPGPEARRHLDQRMAQLLSPGGLAGEANDLAQLAAASRRSPRPQPTLTGQRSELSKTLLQKKAVGAVAALATGMLAGAFLLGRVTSAPGVMPPTAMSHAAPMAVVAATPQQAPDPSASAFTPERLQHGEVPPGDEEAPASQAPRVSGASDGSVSSTQSAVRGEGTDDLALLAAVERALREGQSEQALKKIARGVSPAFEQQARALQSLALCQAGRTAAGQEQARQVLARWPRSVFGPRLTTGCGL